MNNIFLIHMNDRHDSFFTDYYAFKHKNIDCDMLNSRRIGVIESSSNILEEIMLLFNDIHKPRDEDLMYNVDKCVLLVIKEKNTFYAMHLWEVLRTEHGDMILYYWIGNHKMTNIGYTPLNRQLMVNSTREQQSIVVG